MCIYSSYQLSFKKSAETDMSVLYHLKMLGFIFVSCCLLCMGNFVKGGASNIYLISCSTLYESLCCPKKDKNAMGI